MNISFFSQVNKVNCNSFFSITPGSALALPITLLATSTLKMWVDEHYFTDPMQPGIGKELSHLSMTVLTSCLSTFLVNSGLTLFIGDHVNFLSSTKKGFVLGVFIHFVIRAVKFVMHLFNPEQDSLKLILKDIENLKKAASTVPCMSRCCYWGAFDPKIPIYTDEGNKESLDLAYCTLFKEKDGRIKATYIFTKYLNDDQPQETIYINEDIRGNTAYTQAKISGGHHPAEWFECHVQCLREAFVLPHLKKLSGPLGQKVKKIEEEIETAKERSLEQAKLWREVKP